MPGLWSCFTGTYAVGASLLSVYLQQLYLQVERPGGFMSQATPSKDRASTQHEQTEAGDGAGTSTPACQKDDVHYTERSLNSTDRRTDVRATDGHYSWREVAATCHVEPGR